MEELSFFGRLRNFLQYVSSYSSSIVNYFVLFPCSSEQNRIFFNGGSENIATSLISRERKYLLTASIILLYNHLPSSVYKAKFLSCIQVLL